MKTFAPTVLALCIAQELIQAQVALPIQSGTTPTLSVVELGPNYRICADTNSDANLGQLTPGGTVALAKPQPIHNRIEIATGMNYFNPANGAYETSQPEFTPTTDGSGFVADKVQHKLHLNSQIYGQAALTIDFEGMELQCSPAAIGIYNAADGTSAVIGTLTNSTGIQIATNQIVFDDTFAGVCASEVFTVEAGTVHADTVFTGKLDPTAWGFSTNDPLRIQIFTEFFGQLPQPDVLEQPVYIEGSEAIRSRMVSPDLMNQTIGFGNLVFSTGRAYTMPTSNDPAGTGVVVAKEFVTTTDGRNFLVETVDFKFIQQLLSLPDCSLPSGSAKVIRKGDAQGLYASIPQPVRASQAKNLMKSPKLARAHMRPKGVRIDWIANVGGNLNNPFVFAADTNWFVNGAVYCNAATTFEGGTVLKFPTNTAFISLGSTVTLKTSGSRAAICTAVDDDGVGSSFTNWPGANYTGVINPNGYANPAIIMNQTLLTLSNFRFCYAKQAIQYISPSPSTPATLTVNDSQFVNCIRGIEIDSGGTGVGTAIIAVNLNNSLMANVQKPVMGGSPANSVNVALVNCTVDQGVQLINGSWAYHINVFSTNSIYANLTNSSTGVTLNGNNNGFYSDAQSFGTVQYVVFTSPFQQIGAGYYYLTDASGFRNAGTSSGLPSSLLTDLASRTTYPPLVFSETTFNTSQTYSPQAQRDSDTPDLGFHYFPIDYAFGLCAFTNSAAMIVNPGTVIAGFAFPTNKAYGLNFGGGATLLAQGVPNNMVRFVSHNAVQEQPSSGWSEATQDGLITDVISSVAAGGYNLRFTDLSSPALDVFVADISSAVANLQDCQVHGGNLQGFLATMNLTNCLLERVNTTLESFDGNIPGVRDCTVFGGTFAFAPNPTNAVVKDNLFDQAAMSTLNGGYIGGHNAYVTNCSKYQCCILYPTNVTDTILSNSPAYQSSWYGNYYLPTNSNLIDAGSTNANYLGLYHYTTQTSQLKETNTVVDIGWHAVAADSNGNPIDSNGDGIPDYLSDANGNGTVDSGEISWNTIGDLGLKVWITKPNNNSVIP